MNKTIPTYAIGALVLGLLASCANTPEVTKATASIQQLENAKLPRLNIQFQKNSDDTVNFDFGVDNLDPEAKRIIDTQVAWILAHPHFRFSVYGHTDSVGSDARNQQLGLRRAINVVNYIESQGVDPDRLEVVVSKGESIPIVVTESRSRDNRRATTYVAGVYFVETADSDDDGPLNWRFAYAAKKPSKKPVTTPDRSEPENSSPSQSTPQDSPPEESPPTDTSPASTPPASTPPADTTPASTPPADTPPADTPPADTPPADTPPETSPPENTPPQSTEPSDPDTSKDKKDKKDKPDNSPSGGGKSQSESNAGGGNGGEESGDPGNSETHNQAGDDV